MKRPIDFREHPVLPGRIEVDSIVQEVVFRIDDLEEIRAALHQRGARADVEKALAILCKQRMTRIGGCPVRC
jgi:hypothetical protein